MFQHVMDDELGAVAMGEFDYGTQQLKLNLGRKVTAKGYQDRNCK